MEHEDKLEKIIIENSDWFNSEEPYEGHFERFATKLKKEPKRKTVRLYNILKVAAVAAFLLLALNQVRIWLSPVDRDPVTLASISPEYAEIEYFYTTSIQNGIESWKMLASSGVVPETEKEAIKSELQEFDRRFAEIQAELETNPYDERVVDAMLEYYQSKLSVINMIINKLQEVKQQKNIKYETEV